MLGASLVGHGSPLHGVVRSEMRGTPIAVPGASATPFVPTSRHLNLGKSWPLPPSRPLTPPFRPPEVSTTFLHLGLFFYCANQYF